MRKEKKKKKRGVNHQRKQTVFDDSHPAASEVEIRSRKSVNSLRAETCDRSSYLSHSLFFCSCSSRTISGGTHTLTNAIKVRASRPGETKIYRPFVCLSVRPFVHSMEIISGWFVVNIAKWGGGDYVPDRRSSRQAGRRPTDRVTRSKRTLQDTRERRARAYVLLLFPLFLFLVRCVERGESERKEREKMGRHRTLIGSDDDFNRPGEAISRAASQKVNR